MSETNPYDSPDKAPEPVAVKGEPEQPSGPSGLGGWLVLVGIGLVLAPFRIAGFLLVYLVPIFTDGTWEILTTPGTPQYQALWAPLLILELVANLGFMGAYTVLAILFFQKSRYFPKAYIVVALLNLGFIILDASLGSMVLPGEPMFDSETVKEIVRSIVSVAIWVPYMLFSQRVKNTFV